MKTRAMGCIRGLPDVRDFTPDTPKIKAMFSESAVLSSSPSLPEKVDLSEFFSPVENQGGIGSCTANAGVGLLEYFERRAFGNHLDASRLFLYKTTRNLHGMKGDTGAWLRYTMKAMALFGVCPEKFVPYVEADFDNEPSAFAYALAQNYQAIEYYRVDSAILPEFSIVDRLKLFLSAGYPWMFGVSLYNEGNAAGEFPFPSLTDTLLGGHAMVAAGYDDKRVIDMDIGAFKLRNSWGTDWGENGYGWLPYRYIRHGLAFDFWSLLKSEYVDSGQFE